MNLRGENRAWAAGLVFGAFGCVLAGAQLAPAQNPASAGQPARAQQAAPGLKTAPVSTKASQMSGAPGDQAAPAGEPAAAQQTPDAPQAPVAPPAALARATASQAERIWSVALDADALPVLPTEAAFAGTRSAAIFADRADALFKTSSEVSHGGRPVSTYRLVSLDLKTGAVKGQKEIQGQSFPDLFATADDRLIVGHISLTRLNPDLSASGEEYKQTGQGRTLSISPDGSELAHWADGKTELLDARTLSSAGVRIAAEGRWSEPAAVSKSAILSSDARWVSQFPQELTFITLIDGAGMHLLYHGPCGGRPAFLSAEKILFVGCGKVTVIDATGKLLKELPLGAAYGGFAGVSRDGSRFAVVSTDYSAGDPSYQPDELFTIYNSETYAAVAVAAPETPSQSRSWSAFSPDGKLFLSGDAKRLSLYKIP
jgi:hypothetical protein